MESCCGPEPMNCLSPKFRSCWDGSSPASRRKPQTLEEQLTQLAEQSSRMEQQLGAAQQRAEARKQLEREQQLLDSAKAEEESALQAEQQAESTKERQEQLAGWLAVAREKLPQYAELERARLAVRERRGALERVQGQLERIGAAAKALARPPGAAGAGAGGAPGDR